MSEIYRALVDLEIYGSIEEGNQNLHEIVLYAGEVYEFELEAEEDEALLDFYITDEDDKVIYQANAPSDEVVTCYKPEMDAVYRFYVKSVSGSSDYVIRIVEQE